MKPPPPARLPLLLYRLLFPVVLLVMLPAFFLRMVRRGRYRHKFWQRLGVFSAEDRARLGAGGWTWIHAVSVGEMMMGLKLARAIREAQPGARILFSTTTSTGFDVACKAGEECNLIYFPLDMLGIVRRTLDLIRPAQLVMVDKELWPNWITECHLRGIPVSIVNARLSPRSERGFTRWRRWTSPFFAMLHRVCVQEPGDIERWRRLGVRSEALCYTGSLKFDFDPQETSRAAEFRALLNDVKGSVLLAGSTFAGEEAIMARVAKTLRQRWPDLFLIVAPRHVERTPSVANELRAMGCRVALRTEWPQPADTLIINTTGELRDWYAVADVCFIGKSLTATGGQNPAEPVLAGRPVVFGPHMENFEPLVSQLLVANGAVQVSDEPALAQAVERLLSDPQAGEALVTNARRVLAVHAGANRRTAQLLLAVG